MTWTDRLYVLRFRYAVNCENANGENRCDWLHFVLYHGMAHFCVCLSFNFAILLSSCGSSRVMYCVFFWASCPNAQIHIFVFWDIYLYNYLLVIIISSRLVKVVGCFCGFQYYRNARVGQVVKYCVIVQYLFAKKKLFLLLFLLKVNVIFTFHSFSNCLTFHNFFKIGWKDLNRLVDVKFKLWQLVLLSQKGNTCSVNVSIILFPLVSNGRTIMWLFCTIQKVCSRIYSF